MTSVNEFLRRNFGALFAFVMMVGAESHLITLIAVLMGVAFDRLCRRFGVNYDEITKRVDEAGGDLSVVPMPRIRFLVWILYGIWAVYVIIFFSFQVALPEATIRSYLGLWQGFHNVTMSLFYMPRAHFRSTVEHGYEYRALVTVHSYGISHLFFLLITFIWIWLGGLSSPLWVIKNNYLPLRRGESKPFKAFYPIMVFLIFSILYLLFTLVPVDYQPGHSRPWAPHLSNETLFKHQILFACLAVAFPVCLQVAEFGRMRCLQLRRAMSNKPNSTNGEVDASVL